MKLKHCDSCQKEKPIWKNFQGNKYCQYCWNSIKAGEGSYTIPKVSSKRAKKDEEYSKLRKKFLLDNPTCQINVNGCSIQATDVHHTHAGKDRDVYYLIQSTWKASCRNCHDFLHLNPKIARELGWLK